MQITLFDIIGWVGAIGLLAGYFLFSAGRFEGRLWVYHIFNFCSSALLLANAIHTNSGPFIMVNTVWCIIAVYSIFKEKAKAK